MKKIIAITAASLLSLTLFAQSGKNIYSKYSDKQNVSAVYISPSMFNLIGKLPEMDMSGADMDFSSIIRSLKGFYLIESSNVSINSSLLKDVDNRVKSGNYELLMEAKESGETVHFYTVGDKETITNFVMVVQETSSCTFICMEGNMSRAKLEEIIAKEVN